MTLQRILQSLIFFILANVIIGSNSSKLSSPEGGEVRGHSGYSQQYHYSSYGSGQRPSGGGQKSPGQYETAADAVAADPTYALYLAVGFIILFVALGYIIYPILSEKIPRDGSENERTFKSYWDAKTTQNILTAIEKVYETYKRE